MTMNHLSPQIIKQFQDDVWAFYAQNRRQMPWREPDENGVHDPYGIMVSELMLQQTQVTRVIPKYTAFIAAFPNVSSLAQADLAAVLKLWSGLGYNRRAKFLWLAAQQIASDYSGVVPNDVTKLQKLPGIGANTAAAICAYAFDEPVIFVETNIRTVFLFSFFTNAEKVSDTQILSFVKQTLPVQNIRDWYYALMDLGAYYKAEHGNQNKRSMTYSRQKTFKGSMRQLRGKVLKALAKKPATQKALEGVISDDRMTVVLGQLEKEQLIHKTHEKYHIG